MIIERITSCENIPDKLIELRVRLLIAKTRMSPAQFFSMFELRDVSCDGDSLVMEWFVSGPRAERYFREFQRVGLVGRE